MRTETQDDSFLACKSKKTDCAPFRFITASPPTFQHPRNVPGVSRHSLSIPQDLDMQQFPLISGSMLKARRTSVDTIPLDKLVPYETSLTAYRDRSRVSVLPVLWYVIWRIVEEKSKKLHVYCIKLKIMSKLIAKVSLLIWSTIMIE